MIIIPNSSNSEFKQKGRKAVKLDVGAKDPVETVPMVVTKPGVNVIEFNIIHK